MAHRPILTDRQRNDLLALPSDEATILQYYVLSDDDLAHIRKKLNPHNKLGFALQLCAFRYPGRYLHKGEMIPQSMLSFIAAQLHLSEEAVIDYAKRPETRYRHTKELRDIYHYTSHTKLSQKSFKDWLVQAAIDTRNNA